MPPGDYPESYNTPLPEGERPSQGGPLGGDISVVYEANWDLWQQWFNSVTLKVPYMVLPGNHEAACAEFDGPGNVLTAYLNNDEPNATAPATNLTYYSCPPSQRYVPILLAKRILFTLPSHQRRKKKKKKKKRKRKNPKI